MVIVGVPAAKPGISATRTGHTLGEGHWGRESFEIEIRGGLGGQEFLELEVQLIHVECLGDSHVAEFAFQFEEAFAHASQAVVYPIEGLGDGGRRRRNGRRRLHRRRGRLSQRQHGGCEYAAHRIHGSKADHIVLTFFTVSVFAVSDVGAQYANLE